MATEDPKKPRHDPPSDPERTVVMPSETVRARADSPAGAGGTPEDAPETVRVDPSQADAPQAPTSFAEMTTPGWSEVLRGESLGDRLVAERYRLKELLGRGGFASVYIAEDTLLERRVALKLLDRQGGAQGKEEASRFLREARTVARLKHDNVVLLYDAGEDPLGLYLVLELISGKSLDERKGDEYPVAEAVKIVRQAAAGLAAAHALEIVHRDIKPGNVLMTEDGVAKLTDFGLAQSQGESRLTAEGHVVGTPSYMAPEQIEGGQIGPAADLFALGCLFHELLSGSSPFRAPTLSETFARILRGRPEALGDDLREAEPDLCWLIERMLDKRAEKRPSAAEITESLQAWENNHADGGDLTLSGTLFAQRRRKFGPAIAAVLILLVGAAAGWVFLKPAPTQDTGGNRVQVEQISGPDMVVDIPDQLPPTEGEGVDGDTADGVDEDGVGEDLAAGDFSEEAEDPEDPVVIADGEALQAVLDVLEGHRFLGEAHRFLGDEASSRRVSFSFQQLSTAKFLREIARATGWSIVLHTSVAQSPKLQLELNDVPWDVAVESVLERQGLRATHYGDVWMISSAAKSAVIAQRIAPSVVIRRPKKESPSKMAEALQTARSDQGVVLFNRRLRAVLIADRVDAFPGYAKVWAALDNGTVLDVPTREYGGEKISMNLENAEVDETVRALAEIGGLNAVLHDEVVGRVSLDLQGIPWDNAFELLLLSLDLTYNVNDNVVEVRRPDENADLHVETVKVKRDAEFYQPLQRCLTDEGDLSVSDDTIILRDRKDRAVWLRGLIERVDGMSRGDVAE